MKRWNHLLLIVLIMLSGCSAQTRVIDDIALATAAGYDYVPSNQIKSIIATPNYNPDKSITNKFYTDVAPLIREDKAKLDARSSRPLLAGKVNVVVFNQELAKHGLFKYVDYLVRDPDIGSRVILAITKNSVADIINPKNDYDQQDAGSFLSDLIEQNEINSVLPKTNLHTFYYQYYAPGMDPYLPMLTRKGNQVAFGGVALFKSDKYIGSLPFQKMFAFNLLVQRFNNGVFTIHKGKDSTVIENINGTRKIKVSYKNGDPIATVYLKVIGHVREYRGKVINPSKLTQLNQDFKNDLKKQSKLLILQLQKWTVDPVGFGEAARSQNRGFNLNKWHEDYPDMKVNIVVDTKLTEFGVER